jgi:ribosomal protein S2
VSISKDFKNLLQYKNFLEMDRNPHLIVIFNEENLENLVPEVSKLNIPIIYFGRAVKRVKQYLLIPIMILINNK